MSRRLLSRLLPRRADGHLADDVPPYRRMVPYLMRGRNEAAVYFEQTLDLSNTLPWIEQWNQARPHRITVFYVILHAIARVLHERPRLNRFVSGRRIYQRDGIFVSFVAKKRFDDDAPVSPVKRRFEPAESFADMVAALSSDVRGARSDRASTVDRELDVLLRLPPLLLDGAVRLLHALDFYNLAPHKLLASDPMYTSVFVANLGSIQIDAAYHHLYEHGNCGLFVTIGKIRQGDAPVVDLKFSFDERIEDGLYCARALELLKRYVEAPAAWLGD